MRILLTGHKGYIGAVAGPILSAAGHEVFGLDADLFAAVSSGTGLRRFRRFAKTPLDPWALTELSNEYRLNLPDS
jgi:nucleoside-diphosphate-sugar epimerase